MLLEALFLMSAVIAARDSSPADWGTEKDAQKARDLYKNAK